VNAALFAAGLALTQSPSYPSREWGSRQLDRAGWVELYDLSFSHPAAETRRRCSEAAKRHARKFVLTLYPDGPGGGVRFTATRLCTRPWAGAVALDAIYLVYPNAEIWDVFGADPVGLLRDSPTTYYGPSFPDADPVAMHLWTVQAVAGRGPYAVRSVLSHHYEGVLWQILSSLWNNSLTTP
jgi:hypothetical protein